MIRDAVRGDEVAIMGLIRDLAIYEKAEDQVINTADELGKHLFDEKVCSAIVAVDEKTDAIVGFALYYDCYSTWRGKCLYLEDFYVSPEYRRTGMGSLLFDRVVEIAKEKNAKRLDFVVLSWNMPALDFYRKKSVNVLEDWAVGQLHLIEK